uniref:NADH-ubiquinone oxidoreductase chain 1 n=1 Tax=Unionicola parkeri TaxID=350891 RepID=E3W3M5_9ACAR|nr:NADH dehydrogenase subunit 1 [Unionicola parkeri]ADP01835.1 NADH dehydrogenase subunit 1 [Unionicola parkeri]
MFSFLFILLFVLISIAFFTLFEVKGLGSFHLRVGPDKVFFVGVFQPFADFLKLFFKSSYVLSFYYFFFFFFSPCFGVFLSFFIWLNYFSLFSFFSFSFGVLFFFFLSSLSIFFLLFSGLFSGSVYSKLGSFRASSQAVSYEVGMIFIFLGFLFFFPSFSLFVLFFEGWGVYFFLLSFPLFFCWFFSCIAETGRSPFDFVEGESELVSGFNTEYFSEYFVFIFLGEYSFIIFLCFLTSFFFGMGFYFLSVFLFGMIFVWVRASFPRFRFDMLMMFCWKNMLLFVMCLVYFCFFFSLF